MDLPVSNISDLRNLSSIFTPESFNKIVRKRDFSSFKNKARRLGYANSQSVEEFIKSAYQTLAKHHKTEYFFKNILLSKCLKEHKSANATAFHEFKISKSIADLVVLNGAATVYEIKSDLDDLKKLEKQIQDYQQFAEEVYVVTTQKYLSAIQESYKHTSVGIIELTTRNTLKRHKEAQNNTSNFEYDTIFKLLRKDEYLEIISEHYGYIPDVPNTLIFRECLQLSKKIELLEFHKLAVKTLKRRKIKCLDLCVAKETPKELRQICYSMNFSSSEYDTFYKFLKTAL